ncbi:MAG TPA: glycosyl hydrolase [Chitinophagaceae bacterium]|nr:glycosyl hydrolase [Chitinophagaceae bacterium]
MRRRTFIKRAGAAGLIVFVTPPDIVQTFRDPLEDAFLNPSHGAQPQTYWFWMNGNVTREGITLDLEAMKNAGVGGVFNFDVGTGIPKGPVEYLSKEWLELKKHAIREAGRLGLEFTMHNCPGWSASGGPWITPELAMQQVTWSETYMAGGNQIDLTLPKPLTRLNYYRELSVLAFPSLQGEDLMQTVKLHSSNGPVEKEKLTGDEKGVAVQPANDGQAWLQFEFERPFEVKMITFFISAPYDASLAGRPLEFGERTSIRLEASDDGVQFRQVTLINTGVNTELMVGNKYIVFDIPVTTAKYFRLASAQPRIYKQVQFSGITRLKNWMEKTNTRARNFTLVEESSSILANYAQAPAGSVIDLATVLDITKHMDKDGKLSWNAPPGNWTILRMGITVTGMLNRAAPETGIGLECDKYNPAAITFHFNTMMKHLLPDMKLLAAKGKAGLCIDSYEVGAQNWTAGFDQLFKKRWGYNIIPYLPILAGGRIINSIEITERFLWDLRKLQSELIADNYYGKFDQLCRLHNITSYIEPYDSGPMEEMHIGSKVRTNMGEFWNGISSLSPFKNPAFRTVKLAASIAHINGQRITGAEAFTAEPDSSKWLEYPFALKALGDKFFTQGANRFVIHRYAHQPHPTATPGMTMGPWGIHFDRTNTLWHAGRAWLRYLTRCQSMLQQGRFVADLLYFAGEDANMYTKANPEDLHPVPPPGFDYDLVNAEVILNKTKIVNNHIELHSGMTYRVLILQDYKVLSLALLRKLHSLVQQGMALVGEKPVKPAGLQADESAFKSIVQEVWGNIDGETVTEHHFGKGRVYWGRPIQDILLNLKLLPDFQFTSTSGDAPLRYIHRKWNDNDIYFISNQRRTYEDTVCTFRVPNKQPELWDAVTGKIIRAGIYEVLNGRMRLPVQLEPYGSVFVVFRKPVTQHWQAVEKDGKVLLGANNLYPAFKPSLFTDKQNNFAVLFWARPEINVLLNPDFLMGIIRQPWTDYYAAYAPAGHSIHGEGHAICGITVGRNGVGIWEHATGNPVLVLPVPVAIQGWAHIAIVYKNGTPAVYVNGALVKEGNKSKHIVHPPPLGLSREGSSYYNGDMTDPLVVDADISDNMLNSFAATGPPKYEPSPFTVEACEADKPSLLIKQDGDYVLRRNSGKTMPFSVSGLGSPIQLTGPWMINFPPGSGAPEKIIVQQLASLHEDPRDGVKYFSGTASYSHGFSLPIEPMQGKRWILDLGSVAVIAAVTVNGKHAGMLWKRPYSIDVTGMLQPGLNTIEINVTNQWTNRLIGDERLPDPYKFTPGGGSSGMQGAVGGAIEKIPDWYMQGNPKPNDGRITFATWKQYSKDAPLQESGLIGPVTLQLAVVKVL